MVAPGTIISSALAFVPISDEEALAEETRPLTPSEEELHDPEAPHTFEIQPMYCQWEGCHQGFWELEDMVQHLHDSHIDNQAAKRPQCEWIECPRKGKPQTSKFALLAHLRSHTGEKPFVCPRPECDKSFTRTDALQKHMRVQHNESMPLSRKPPTKKGGKVDEALEAGPSIPSAQSHEEVLDSSNAMYDPALLATGTPVTLAPIASGSATPRLTTPSSAPSQLPGQEEEEILDDPEVAQAIESNPHIPPDQVRYLCYLARHKYAAQERESLQAELDLLESKKEDIQQDKDKMLDTIFLKEIGPEAEAVVRPIRDEEIPPLHWKLANRTSLPNIGVRDVKVNKDEDEEE
ncbi:hypothetical protein P389DRAFT_92650 [Cystobasidium minutum MCA 4210]|uniref:uncharacterized protein n=1 Tax=Cystobasidium minutum MCA 4210 TaxID=1397322 RepID=UPI0034CE2E27|eukprot:jgi/Rhomi1/92650/CE92649_373